MNAALALCSADNPRHSRRSWLRWGLASVATARLAPWLRLSGSASAAPGEVGSDWTARPGFGRAKSVIYLYASGGQSQLDTWDPKPDAPREIRGEFASIETRVPGLRICEHLPQMARVMDRCTLLRSLSHDDLDHGSATYLALTGQFHPRKSSNPPPAPTDYPTYGAILTRVRPNRHFPYTAIQVNGPALVPTEPSPGQDGGFLGREFSPLVLGDVTSDAQALPGLDPLEQLSTVRIQSRRQLWQSLDAARRQMGRDRSLLDFDTLYRQAFDLLDAPQSRRAFDLSAEPDTLRDRYGRHRVGQACLLARRLVEAGVPYVNVVACHSNRGQDLAPADPEAYGWDTHNNIFHDLKDQLLPRFDQAFSALLLDLDQRGLLDSTLVVCVGEFGRAPVVALESKFVGSMPGRKHWASAYSAVLAGAGIARGAIYGATDSSGGHVSLDPHSPGDLAATLFFALGLDPAGHYRDPTGRPIGLVTGRPIAGLFRS